MRSHRSLITIAVLATLVVAATSCGSAADSAITTRRSNSSSIDYPSDPDTAILRIGDPYTAPALVIGGDRWVYAASGDPVDAPPTTPAGIVQAVPAPPAPTPFQRRRLTDEGIQIVLALAKDKGLLQKQEYESPGVTDSGTSSLSVTDSTGTYEHDAYALGFEKETGNRKDLQDFLAAMEDLGGLVGNDNLGPAESYLPTTFLVSINGSYVTEGDPISWPDGLTVTEGCVDLPVGRFATGVVGVYIADVGGATTRVAVVPDLPGDSC